MYQRHAVELQGGLPKRMANLNVTVYLYGQAGFMYVWVSQWMCWCACVCLTPNPWQNTDVGLVEQRQSIMTDVKMREVRDEIVPHQEPH